jgi:hypothetical protein
MTAGWRTPAPATANDDQIGRALPYPAWEAPEPGRRYQFSWSDLQVTVHAEGPLRTARDRRCTSKCGLSVVVTKHVSLSLGRAGRQRVMSTRRHARQFPRRSHAPVGESQARFYQTDRTGSVGQVRGWEDKRGDSPLA